MEKPPVLNEEQVIKWIKDNYGENAIIAPLAHGKTAQRDADVEWFENERDKFNYWFNKNDERVQQAHQDTAREIFETINNWLERHAPVTFPWNGYGFFIQSLKSKFLIPPNPVGSADV